MKGFLEWFKSSTKIKRWIMLILLGIILSCYGFSVILNSKELDFLGIGRIIVSFVIGFTFIIIGLIYIQKRTLELVIENEKTSNVNLKSLIFNKSIYEKGPNVVVIGGGAGINTVLKGLKQYTNNITAIVTVSDYGNSIDNSLELLPTDDIKSGIVALSSNEKLMQDLLNLKFEGSTLNFGDMYLSAMQEVCGDFTSSVEKTSDILKITGKVLPVTLDKFNICAELKDGTVVEQKDKIPEAVINKVTKINRIYINPSNCRPAPGVLEAIEKADAIIIGPGSLYTNVIPNLLVKGVAKTIKESKAIKVYVNNIMTEQGQTDNYSLTDHIDAIIEHVGKEVMNFCICDTGEIIPEFIRKYNLEGSDIVENDITKARTRDITIIQKNMSYIVGDRIRHNSDVIAKTIIELICNDLKYNDKQNDTQYLLLNSKLKEEKDIEKGKEKEVKIEKNNINKIESKFKKDEPKRKSKFKEKYEERIKGIQESEKIRVQNRIAFEETEKAKELEEKKRRKIERKNDKNKAGKRMKK